MDPLPLRAPLIVAALAVAASCPAQPVTLAPPHGPVVGNRPDRPLPGLLPHLPIPGAQPDGPPAPAQPDTGFPRPPREVVRMLLSGNGPGTLRVLCMGNSRTARPTGFAFDGLEEIVFEQGRLAGNGNVTPLYGAEQIPADTRYLFNTGPSMTQTDPSWGAFDFPSLLHAHDTLALRLVPGRPVKMANFGNSIPMLRRNAPVEITLQHLLGPDRGVYRVVPVEVEGDTTIVRALPPIEINCAAPAYRAAYTRVTLPGMVEPLLNRAIVLEGVLGQCTVFAINADRDVPGGVSISEMGVSGDGYPRQAAEASVPAPSWTAFVAAAGPDIVFWFYAANQGYDGIADATRTLMDRVATVRPDALHILVCDHPTPVTDSARTVRKSREWAEELEGYRGAVVIDPAPYLPPEFAALQGTGQLGVYFANDIHENRAGARAVGDALWRALEAFAGACYADCDQTTGPGTLDIFDWLCFQNRFGTADPYACDCDITAGWGVCDIFDFLCFQNAFGTGCP